MVAREYCRYAKAQKELDMTSHSPHRELSHTRGVPLGNLAGLCLILAESKRTLNVRELFESAIKLGIVESEPVPKGKPLPSRINHHMISLRELELVRPEHSRGHVYYSINPLGRRIGIAARNDFSEGPVELNHRLRAVWRSALSKSLYVRCFWLKYFMKEEDFDLKALLNNSGPITIIRLPNQERENSPDEPTTERFHDSGYRIKSQHWDEKMIYAVERREILHGLRQWTNEIYLTDEGVPAAEAAPFAYLSVVENSGPFEIESVIVQAWFDPERDLLRFERLVDNILDRRRQGNRIGIPDLLIAMSHEYGYAKENIKEMLTVLFYERGNKYFFERGSKFLVDNAFKLTRRDKPSAYYLNLEGSWRTSIVRCVAT